MNGKLNDDLASFAVVEPKETELNWTELCCVLLSWADEEYVYFRNLNNLRLGILLVHNIMRMNIA